MAKYKCLISGNVIEFTNQVDIDSMVGHAGYIKLDEETVKVAPSTAKKAKAVQEATATKEAE